MLFGILLPLAIGVAISGVVADQFGLVPTMTFNAWLPLGAAALAVLLPEDQPTVARMK